MEYISHFSQVPCSLSN